MDAEHLVRERTRVVEGLDDDLRSWASSDGADATDLVAATGELKANAILGLRSGLPAATSLAVSLGHWLRVSGEAESARHLARRLLRTSRTLDDHRAQGHALWALAWADLPTDPQRAARLFGWAASKYDEADDPAGLTDAMLGSAVAEFQRGDIERARDGFGAVRTSSQDARGQADACWGLAIVALHDTQPETAAAFFDEAHSLQRDSPGTPARLRASLGWAVAPSDPTRHDSGDAQLGISSKLQNAASQADQGFAETSATVARRMDSIFALVSAADPTGKLREQLGSLFASMGDAIATAGASVADAIDRERPAYWLYEQVGDRSRQAAEALVVAATARSRQQLLVANAAYFLAASLYRTAGSSAELATTLCGAGQVAVAREDLATARDHYEEAAASCDEVVESDRRARTYQRLGRLAEAIGRGAAARLHYHESLVLFELLGDTASVRDCANAIGRLDGVPPPIH